MDNTPLLEYGIVHTGIYWLIKNATTCTVACLLMVFALREVKESKLLLAFGQCIMKLLGSNITFFKTETNFEN